MAFSAGKTLIQIISCLTAFLKKGGRNVDDDPFIDRSVVDHRPVNLTCPHQNDVQRLQVVLFPLNDIADIALEKDQYFMKIMIVIFEAFNVLIGNIKQFKFIIQIAGFLVG